MKTDLKTIEEVISHCKFDIWTEDAGGMWRASHYVDLIKKIIEREYIKREDVINIINKKQDEISMENVDDEKGVITKHWYIKKDRMDVLQEVKDQIRGKKLKKK